MIQLLVRMVRDKYGFTLIEVALAAGLTVLVLLAALEVSWRVWGLVGISSVNFNENAELRNATYWVTRDLRRAETIDAAIPGRLVITAGNNTIVYTLDGDSLVRGEGNSRRTVAKGITVADFSADKRDGGVLVAAEFKGQKGGVRTCVWVYTGD